MLIINSHKAFFKGKSSINVFSIVFNSNLLCNDPMYSAAQKDMCIFFELRSIILFLLFGATQRLNVHHPFQSLFTYYQVLSRILKDQGLIS